MKQIIITDHDAYLPRRPEVGELGEAGVRTAPFAHNVPDPLEEGKKRKKKERKGRIKD